MQSKILIIEDDPDIVKLIQFHCEQEGYGVSVAGDGAIGLKKAQAEKPDLILLDLMLPQANGLDICRILKGDPATQKIPVIMITAKREEVDRIVGFELGADDYVSKPFSPRELLLRIKAILKRVESASEISEKEKIAEGDVEIDISRHEVKVRGVAVVLTKTEFNLLLTLVKRKGRVLSRDVLLDQVWGYEVEVDTRTVDTHMRRLREKMGPVSKQIETLRGIGYRFKEVE